MDKIYVLKKQKLIQGPYSFDSLKRKGLSYYDMVWYEGLSDWTPVDEVELLATLVKPNAKKIHKTIFDKVFSFLK